VKERLPSRRFRRGIYLLPALFTVGNIFLGFWAIIKVVRGARPSEAAVLIGFSIVLDILDGRIARYTGTTSEFGGELDSLADVISFGVAPAILAYSWAFSSIPRVGWLVSFLFVMCGTMRLARFNVQRHAVDGRYFVGMPIPAAAGQVAAVVNVTQPLHQKPEAVLVACGLTILGLLMVSTLRYRSFKGFDLRSRRPYGYLLWIVIPFIVIALHPRYTLVTAATVYSLSGPTAYVVSLVRRRGDPPPPRELAAGAAH
jgi:CDP-diacylglycerol--serine O-phosphatidyltransferase